MSAFVIVHLVFACCCVILGAVLLAAGRRLQHHRVAGAVWWGAMVVVALSSLGIRGLNHGRLSALHLLSVVVLANLARGAWAISRGNVAAHRRAMISAYAGLVVAGIAAVAVPGRLLNVLLTRGIG